MKKLKNWFIEKHNNHVVLYGDVYEDDTSEFTDGTSIRTSYIKDVTEEDGKIFVTTCNSTYELDGSDLQEVKITYDGEQKQYEFLWK